MTAKTQGLHLQFYGLIVAIIFVSGCASLSKEECQTADWRTIGYEDGVQGRPEARIGEHRKACAEHGVALELETYRSGWDEGVARFCQPGNGYQQGRSGRKYAGVCPNALEADFLQAYNDGRALYELEYNIRRLSKKLTYQRKRLTEIDVEMRDAGLELIAKGIPTERRVVLLDELRKLGDERSDIKTRIPPLEAELEDQKQRLSVMSSASAFKVTN
jgi:hypothetical protein